MYLYSLQIKGDSQKKKKVRDYTRLCVEARSVLLKDTIGPQEILNNYETAIGDLL
jgi:hypothetical protein